MSLLSLFGKKKPELPPVIKMESGKVSEHPNPLPAYFPALYEDEAKTDAETRQIILREAREMVEGFLFACRVPRDRIADTIFHDIRLLLDVPAILELQAFLRGRGLKRYYRNNFALATACCTCAFQGETDIAERVRDDLTLVLLGVFLRYYGLRFLKEDERSVLGQDREFDVADARQKELRDQFLKRYRAVADKLARMSAERFIQLVGENHDCPKEKFKATLHVLRYSNRLMGRAAGDFSEDELGSIHKLASYVAVLFNVASPWASKRKRLSLVLAEEWGRHRTHCRIRGSVTIDAMHNVHALSDLFRICRCEVLPNFQNTGQDAIYSAPDNILIKEVNAVAVLKEGSDKSVRRFVNREEDEEGGGAKTASPSNKSGRRILQKRWQSFKPKKPIKVRGRNLMDALLEKHIASHDPGDEDLQAVE